MTRITKLNVAIGVLRLGLGLGLGLGLATGCTRPAESRAGKELDVGTAELTDATVTVVDGLAAVRALTDRHLELWAGAPAIDVVIELGPTASGPWTLLARNTLRDAELTLDGTAVPRVTTDQSTLTVAAFDLVLTAGPHQLRIAPPDANTVEPFRVAAMADIQTALPEVDDVFRQIDTVPDARFVVAMGDITQRAKVEEFDQFERQLETLDIPYYTTLGNHELWGPPERYFDRYGRASFHFVFKGAAFTFVDSGDAGLDPIVEEWLDGWLAQSRDQLHVFLTHIPPVDPIGVRYGSFRSTRDGYRLIERLVEGKVDLALYGHIHTYYPYANAGIPSYISGGGGADPMRFDGIDRHFLEVTLDPGAGVVRGVVVHLVDNH